MGGVALDVKKGGNKLPIVLPQVTMNRVSNDTQNEIRNVFGENEHGIALAQTGMHRSFLASQRIDGKLFNKWSAK